MNVTIYTDASWQPVTNKASFAYYCKSDKGVLKSHGQFKNLISTPTEAEMACMCNAIFQVVKRWPDTSKIYLNNDSIPSMDILSGVGKNNKYNTYVDFVNKILYKEKPFIELICRHVKAHNNSASDVRSFLNKWCDKKAGEYKKLNLKK